MDLRARMKRGAKHLLIAALVLIVGGIFGGLFVMISGIVPIKASSGHWAITRAFLEFAKRRSVATHSLGVSAPPLDEPRLARQGGGQYGFACEPCHGSPSVPQPRIAAQMTPTPPDLRKTALTYEPEHLFYIVKHGIKLTGMPAWPALERDDEVWAMVAFLRKLPEMEPAEYERLTGRARAEDDVVPLEDLLGPEPSAREAVTENCARCHGVDGLGGRTGAFPKLAGQRAEYLAASLEAYASGERHSGVMEPVAAGLGTDQMRAIARYYAALPAAGGHGGHTHEGPIDQGRRIAERGVPQELIPACSECHAPAAGPPRNPHYPLLAGQHAHYIETQLKLFRQRARGGTPYHEIMQDVAGRLSDEQIRAVAAYFSSLAPQPVSSADSRSQR